jgi:hypothetical protein
MGIVGARFLQIYKHGLSSQITINSSPKPNKILFFKCGFGVDSQGEGWEQKQVSIEIAYITHACVCEFLEGK